MSNNGHDGHAVLRSDGASIRLSLDPGEVEVLQHLATGLSSHEVAGLVGVPVDTVRERLAAAIMKLGAHSRLEAMIIAIRRGLIDPPSE
jgi:DNA-binding NarL/FixJ family response regulator